MSERYAEPSTGPFIPSLEYIQTRKPTFTCVGKELWTIIHQGSFPAVVTGTVCASDFYSSYVRTYFERDVRLLTEVGDELQFLQFLTAVANRTGQVLNYSDIGKEAGISGTTVKRWIFILVTTGIAYVLYPHTANVKKHGLKTPKIYFLDTGLACWLTKWKTAEVLQSGAMAGPMFETFIISEVLKSFFNSGHYPMVSFYRDKDGKEIDLLIDEGEFMYPVEIIKKTTPTTQELANFTLMKQFRNKKIGPKVVVFSSDKLTTLGEDAYALLISYL